MPTPPTLEAIATLVETDPGLPANIPAQDIADGAAAARLMNGVITQAIDATGVNDDGRLNGADLRAISDHIRADPTTYALFVEGHGDDENNVETGFHLVQGDGGALRFQSRNFLDTVADAIYHVGFIYENGRFVNEDGDANEEVLDVAGWLNYFVNGVNIVYGTDGGEELYSGEYSLALHDAESELFLARGGHDAVWTGVGDDTVLGGSGNDTIGGDLGDDVLRGNLGNDQIWAGEGDDRIYGNQGHDEMGGSFGNDRMFGGIGDDRVWGEDGNDTMMGGAGTDTMGGGNGDDSIHAGQGDDRVGGDDGNDEIAGGAGNDGLHGAEGNDTIRGGAGQDTLAGGEGDDWMNGGAGHDTLWGNDGDDYALGALGNDLIDTGLGNDTVLGGGGRDSVAGGGGSDTIDGGAGRDLLQDWENVDAPDVFVFRPGQTGLGDQADEVQGFDKRLDKIDLTAFGGLEFIGTDAFSGGAAVRVIENGIEIDASGDGAADHAIQMSWTGLLDGSDFIL